MLKYGHRKILLILLLSIFIQCHAGDFPDDDDEVIRGDNFIDKLLYDMLEENGHEYDPYYMEDSRVAFSKKVLFVNVSGEAKLHKGYITGLKTLHRPYHCTVDERDGMLYVKADLGAGVLNFKYDGTATFMGIGYTISIHGRLDYLEVHMEFKVDSQTGRDGTLRTFTIDDMKGMDVTVSGLGPLNWALNKMIAAVMSLFKGYTRRLFEKSIRNHIAERLPRYQFPVEKGQTEEPVTFTEPETTEPPIFTEPATTEEPVTFTEPRTTEEPVTFTDLSTTEEQVTFTEPTTTEEPVTFTEPTTTEEPVTFTQSTTTEEPATFTEPGTTEEPVTFTESTTTEEPVAFTEPTTTEEPVTYTETDTTDQPETFTEPEITEVPETLE